MALADFAAEAGIVMDEGSASDGDAESAIAEEPLSEGDGKTM